MHWKTTVALLLATIGIGTYVSLYELKQPDPERREELAKQVLALDPEQVTQLALELPQATCTLVREAGAWRIQPKGVRASQETITALLQHVNPLNAERTLTGSPQQPLDLKTFGLDPAAGRIRLTANGSTTVLRIGETTAVGGKRYLQVEGRPEVHVVDATLFDEANHPVDSFRDQRLIPFDTWKADEVRVTAPSSTFTLERRENVWHLTQPLADLADRTEINALLGALSGLPIKRFLEESVQADALSTWGLDQPKTTAIVTLQETAPVTVAFGQPLPDDASLVYAKRSDESMLYAVAAADLAAFSRDPHGLRATACFEAFVGSITKVALTHEGKTWTISLADAQWTAEGQAAPLETSRVEDFLKTLADLRAAGFVEDAPADLSRYGLAPPAATIEVWDADRGQTPQRLLVGGVVEGGTNRYGRIEGREPVIRLPDLITELLKTTPESLRPPTQGPAEEPPT